ncbi:MAG: hypothetical protein ABW061_24875 [Polyangiaceae bacterium]
MSACVRGAVLALCSAVVLLLSVRAVHAQGADALPALDETPITTPDSSEPPPPPAVTVLKSPERKAGQSALGPIRARRRLALLGEVGWNGIAGFGPNLVYHVHPHFSVDLGAGLSLLGWKVGMRGRYNLLSGPVTPFVGVGVMGAGGFGDSPIPIHDENDDPTRETVNVKIRPSAWLQTVAGIDWIAPSGFNLVGCAGYAFLLSHDPVQVVTGTPNADEKRAFDIAFRSNIVITVALGYSFR